MVHKVAILIANAGYDHCNDGWNSVITSITEWEEISHEDFLILNEASYRKGFSVIEQPTNVKDFIANTVSEEIEKAKEDTKRLAEEKAARAEAIRLKKYKKDLKDKDSKLALFKKLQEELGDAAK